MNEILEKFQLNGKDTGSSAVQIIHMTRRIQEIAAHVKTHRKDNHCLRGLMRCISKRKSLLAYLKKGNQQMYQDLIRALGLRH